MIAMSLLSTYDEYRRDRIPSAPVDTVPAHPLRRTMMHALALGLVGLGVGGVASGGDEETLGIG